MYISFINLLGFIVVKYYATKNKQLSLQLNFPYGLLFLVVLVVLVIIVFGLIIYIMYIYIIYISVNPFRLLWQFLCSKYTFTKTFSCLVAVFFTLFSFSSKIYIYWYMYMSLYICVYIYIFLVGFFGVYFVHYVVTYIVNSNFFSCFMFFRKQFSALSR